ncbi:hypothetical protein WJX73_004007 [Symbiochloris irregularis]|uniref:Uncharacterized protein n=1 Tax=Symbiochloris irregularis TaxID=706552 RepID=A0AAW1PI27_9CHLO
MFSAGAVAGAIGKTLTAPLDRVKLLLQTGGGLQRGSLQQASQKGFIPALISIGREEGLRGYWKGNLPQILKVIPYSATQLCTYDYLKRKMAGNDKSRRLSVWERMLAGASAGMFATLVTYPLDTMRLRMAVDPSVRSFTGTARALVREGSTGAFFRGIGASLIGIAPYVALELTLFDTLPADQLPPFARGFAAAFVATTLCYPLDTIRRQIQLQSAGPVPLSKVLQTINQRGGAAAYYRGFLPNAVKNLPNKGIRLAIFDWAQKAIAASEASLAKASSDGTLQQGAAPRKACCCAA